MNSYNKKSVEDIDVSGKKVLVRCDFNVPLKDGAITSDKRIVAALPTIKYLLEHGAAVILCSHLGRPKGEFKPEFSLAPVAVRLGELLGKPVIMAKDVVGEDAKAKAAALKPGELLMLENVRFEAGETKNNPDLAKAFASLAEIYVNDAFGSAHRAHASTAGVADYLPAVCGFLIQKEITVMGKALSDPKRPFVAILGGAKVSDKIGVINNLLDKVDTLIVGGGMAYTFAKAQGYSIGDSLCEDDKVELAREMLEKAKARASSFFCLWITVSATNLTPIAASRLLAATISPTAGWAWISDPKRKSCSARRSRAQEPLSGMARWVCSSLTSSPAARLRLPRRSRTAARFPSSEAAIRLLPSPSSVSATR